MRKVAAGRGDEPMVTYVLLGIMVLVQLGAMASGANATGSRFGGSQLITDGAVSGPAVADGEIWRLLTAGFLHAGLLHLMFNAFALYVLGTMLEPAIGRLRFAIIYFVSLFAGSFGALLVEPNALTVGASGAIFGLMGAVVVVMRNRGLNFMESGIAAVARDQPRFHVRDPRHLDRRPYRRACRRHARRAPDVRPPGRDQDAPARAGHARRRAWAPPLSSAASRSPRPVARRTRNGPLRASARR